MMAPAVMLVVLTVLTAGAPQPLDTTPLAPPADLASVPPAPLRAQAADVARDPPPGSGAEFVRYAAPPELHNGLLAGGLFAWTGVLIGGLMFLDKRRLASLLIGGGGLAVGLALMLIG